MEKLMTTANNNNKRIGASVLCKKWQNKILKMWNNYLEEIGDLCTAIHHLSVYQLYLRFIVK